MTNNKLHNALAIGNKNNIIDLEWHWTATSSNFRRISHIWKATTTKRS